MSNFNDLVQSNINDDMQNRIKYLKSKTDKELAAAAASVVNDARNVAAAKKILRERGIKGVPQ